MNDIERYKHPRIYHVNWSDGLINDDKRIENMDAFRYAPEVVVTLKMDGENTTVYSDGYIHARSIDSKNHESRNIAKNILSQIAYELPKGWRLCVENLYAKHSIEYANLDSYVYVHSIWTSDNVCLAVDETVVYAQLLGLPYVPIIYRGEYDEQLLKDLFKEKYNGDDMEGYVMRLPGPIAYDDFSVKVSKFVRKGHVQTDEHWMTQQVVPNKLKV